MQNQKKGPSWAVLGIPVFVGLAFLVFSFMLLAVFNVGQEKGKEEGIKIGMELGKKEAEARVVTLKVFTKDKVYMFDLIPAYDQKERRIFVLPPEGWAMRPEILRGRPIVYTGD
jgi:hypothetical protein